MRTLDQVICSDEGIKTADLHVLARKPEATRQLDTKSLSDIVKEIKNDEKLAKEQAKREEATRIQLEKEAAREAKRIEDARKYQSFLQTQQELKMERDRLIAQKNVIYLLGGHDAYLSKLKELNSRIIT